VGKDRGYGSRRDGDALALVNANRSGTIQRARILDAMVRVVYERGYVGASVGAVSAKARMSRQTFYDEFAGREECFLAVLDEGMRHASMLISEAFDREQGSWVDGVRGALASLLTFFDSEPAYGYVLLVEATSAGPRARELRERHIVELTALIEERAGEPAGGHAHSHVTAGVMASLLGVLHTHLVTARQQPLIVLLGPLMGLVTAPYLDQRAMARAIGQGEATAGDLLARHTSEHAQSSLAGGVAEVPGLLLHSRAHRARACISYVAQHPGASNRQVADAVGISGRTQISALLARLHRAGLIRKHPTRPGGANAWTLTPHGHQIVRVLSRQRNDRLDNLARASVVEASPLPREARTYVRSTQEAAQRQHMLRLDGRHNAP
jgi:AcrR family transcriptional regulator